jgi:hypothetical protein
MKSNVIDTDGAIEAKTANAVLVHDGDKAKAVWLARSQIEMDDKSQEMMIQRAKAITEMKMRSHEREELDAAAYQLSAHSNRKERRAFEARQRKRK